MSIPSLTSSEPGAETGPPISILLVDDDAKNLLALESILECPEHRLFKAQTAEAALLAVMERDYAAIVLDVQMPDLNGLELARLIKQRKKTQHIPILFLTAHYREDEHAVLGYDAGAVDYLTKPVNPSVLRSKVSVFVDLFRKTRALAEMNQLMESEIIERKIAEERFRVVVEAAPSAMLLFSSDGVIVLVNSQAEHLFASTREELLRKTIADLLQPETLRYLPADGDSQAAAVGDRVSPLAYEITVDREDDSRVPAQVTFTPIQSPEGTLWLASIVDVTERNQVEAMLRSANEELEAKNLALEREAEERLLRIRAEAAQAEAEAANAAKDRFLAMLSHELRTPLSPVLHSVTLLDENQDCSPEMREALQIIRRNVQLEARLIDDLLDLARIRNGKLQLHVQAVDAHELLNHAMEICRPDIARHLLRVGMRLNARFSVIRGDPARLQQIFWNLINNAVKFTPEGGSITVTTGNEDADNTLRVEVSDTGVGIESHKLTRIFDAFEQATPGGPAGLGLGLAICKALTDFHGGTIAADSDGPGHGATFSVRFPIVHEAVTLIAPENAATPSASARAPRLRLLVVDDHHDTAVTLGRLLVRRGYDVSSAGSVAGALDAAKSHSFDVLVTDIGLPDGTGVELFQALRALPGNEDLRGFALSGFGMDEDIARSKAAGFSHHITKPVDFVLLHRLLSEI